MTDLVEQLRDSDNDSEYTNPLGFERRPTLAWEAADEITRLRAENEGLQNCIKNNPLAWVLDPNRRLFLIEHNYELKYLPVYADQPDPTYVIKWVWEVRNEQGAAVAGAHEWLYAAIDAAKEGE